MAQKTPSLTLASQDLKMRLIWVIGVILVLGVLKTTSLWAGLNGRFFDQISTLSPQRPDAPGIVLVAIDEPSFSQVQQQWPWPRFIHADLLKSLRSAGAKAVAFDIVFDASLYLQNPNQI